MTSGRGSGFGGPDPLRSSDIAAYFQIVGITGAVVIDYYELILGMDRVYLDWCDEQRELRKKHSESKAKKRK